MPNITFINLTKNKIKGINKLKALISYAVTKEKKEKVDFSIIFIDNNTMRELNKQYRQIDQPTDVLAFALGEDKLKYEGNIILGDIYISIDKAKEQAKEYKHSLLYELAFLMIHGLLHLLGYDHMKIKDQKKMFKKQEEILNEIGIKR